MEGTLGHCALAEEAHRRPQASEHPIGEREPDGERQPASHDRVASVQPGRSMKEVHRSAPAPAHAFDAPVHLGHDPVHRHTPRKGMAVVSVRRHDRLVREHLIEHPGRDRLLTYIEVDESTDPFSGVELRAALLEPADAQHGPVERDEIRRSAHLLRRLLL